MTSFVEEKKFLIIVHRRSRSGRRARSQTWSRSGMRPITSRRQHSYSCVKTEASKSSWPTPMRPTSGSRPSSIRCPRSRNRSRRGRRKPVPFDRPVKSHFRLTFLSTARRSRTWSSAGPTCCKSTMSIS